MDVHDGAPWTEMDIDRDRARKRDQGSSIKQAAEFLRD
jgi:hypothetical protein